MPFFQTKELGNNWKPTKNETKTPDTAVDATQATEKSSVADEQTKKDKQALIAAAIERAKAQKLAAATLGSAPENTENVSARVQAEISEIDALREKAKQTIMTNEKDWYSHTKLIVVVASKYP